MSLLVFVFFFPLLDPPCEMGLFFVRKELSDDLRDRKIDNISTRPVNLLKHPLKTTRGVKQKPSTHLLFVRQSKKK